MTHHNFRDHVWVVNKHNIRFHVKFSNWSPVAHSCCFFQVPSENGTKLLKFDRVLADVPCSGDGTLRKNIDAWPKWNAAAAHNLHPLVAWLTRLFWRVLLWLVRMFDGMFCFSRLQSRILKRGLDILEVGGRLVYSTCSFNPIEDEAVLANVLSTYEGNSAWCQNIVCFNSRVLLFYYVFAGSVELVDVIDELPGLKHSKGVSTWSVMSRNGEFFKSFDEVPEKYQTQIRPSMFPPSAALAQELHLDRW